MSKLQIEAGTDTNDMLDFIMNELTDDQLDELEITRDYVRTEALATTPVTIAATITASATLIMAIGTIVSRYLELKRQENAFKAVLRGYEISNQVGREISKLARAHANVTVVINPRDEN